MVVRTTRVAVWTCAAVAALVGLGAAVSAADREVAWFRAANAGNIERELNARARRGLRLAGISDGLPCPAVVMQAPEPAQGPAEYKVVSVRAVADALDGLVEQGFVPRATAATLTPDVVFERAPGARAGAAWKAIEFERNDDLGAALTTAAAEGYRARLLVRPALKSWPGLSQKGVVLAEKATGGAAIESRVIVATKKNVDELSREVATATKAGWQFDLLFTTSRDGDLRGRRERAFVALSKAAGASSGVEVTVERRSSFGIVAKQAVGMATYWDEYLFASAAVDRRQTWGSPIRLSADDAACGLGFSNFIWSESRDNTWTIIGLVAKPGITAGTFEMLVVTDQRLGFR